MCPHFLSPFHPLVHGMVHLLGLEDERNGLEAKRKVCMVEKRLLEELEV